MATKLHVKKGDQVLVLAGNDAGKKGRVIEVIPAKSRVVVDGVNIHKRHTRPTRQSPQGGVIERPGPDPQLERCARVPQLQAAHSTPDRENEGRGSETHLPQVR